MTIAKKSERLNRVYGSVLIGIVVCMKACHLQNIRKACSCV